jgi:hypothetical protein
MSSTERADALALNAAVPELTIPEDTETFLDAMPVPELASIWRILQRSSRRDQTSAAWAALMYFSRLSKRRPDRVLDLALEILRAESDKPTVMRLNDTFMPALIDAHGTEMIDRIAREASTNERFRDLLGGVRCYRAPNESKARLDAPVEQHSGEKLLKPC